MSTQVITPTFRASYPNLFKARKNELSGKDEYSVVALFKKGEDLSKIKAAIEAACEKEWGSDKKKWPKKIRTPLRDQADRGKEDENGDMVLPDGYEAGAYFVNLKTTTAPGLIDRQKNDIIDESKIYAGCYLRADINAFAYEHKGNIGVSFGLNNIQFVADGESLGGGKRRAVDAFDEIATDNAEEIFE